MNNKLGLIIITVILTLSACNKKSTAEVDNETQSILDFSTASREFVSIIPTLHQVLVNTAGTGANQTKNIYSICQVLTKTSGDTLWGTSSHVNPTYSLEISKTTCNALVPDNAKRNVKLFVRLYDKLQNNGAITVVKVKGYWDLMEETSIVQNAYDMCDSLILKTINSDANSISFEITLVNGKLIQGNPYKSIQLTFNLKLTSNLNGVTEPYVSFYGAANGINANGLSFTASIPQQNAIEKSKSCFFYRTGKVEITPFGFTSRTANFGRGLCDDDASFEVNGNTIAFKLK